MLENQEIEIQINGEWKPALFRKYHHGENEAWVKYGDVYRVAKLSEIRPVAKTPIELAREALEFKKSLAESKQSGLENHQSALETMVISMHTYLVSRGLRVDFDAFMDDLAEALKAESVRLGGKI